MALKSQKKHRDTCKIFKDHTKIVLYLGDMLLISEFVTYIGHEFTSVVGLCRPQTYFLYSEHIYNSMIRNSVKLSLIQLYLIDSNIMHRVPIRN